MLFMSDGKFETVGMVRTKSEHAHQQWNVHGIIHE